jgi:hypothetical protein
MILLDLSMNSRINCWTELSLQILLAVIVAQNRSPLRWIDSSVWLLPEVAQSR